MILKEKIKEVPGLAYVMENMELMSSAGKRRMMEQPFLRRSQELDREQMLVQVLRERLERAENANALIVLRHQLMQLHDIRTTLGNLRSHMVLGEVELFEVKQLAFLCGHSQKALMELGVQDLFVLPDLKETFDVLDPDHTGIPNFYFYDTYDIRLTPIRKQMKQADDQQMAKLLAEQNEIQQQVATRLCDQLHAYVDSMEEALEQMAYIDFTLARATLARQWGLVSPARWEEEAAGNPRLQGLFNPRLKQHNESVGLRYQPIDIELTEGVTLVTGANMAGKTMLLKTVGIAQLMYQFGFPVPAEYARLKPMEDVVFCIGDEQNEMNGLSSYAAEITRISDMMYRSEQERIMVLIDEPARTTNPVEGKALVQSITSIMHTKSSITMITTHYSQLGVRCRRLRVKGFVESLADVPLTPQSINRFIDYSLTTDDSDEVPHEALRIAELLDCHPGLINEARQFLKQK